MNSSDTQHITDTNKSRPSLITRLNLLWKIKLHSASLNHPLSFNTRRRLWADEFTSNLISDSCSLSEDEVEFFTQVEDELAVEEKQWTSIDNDLFFPKDKVYKDGSGVGIGRCVGVVQASPERVLAW